MIIQDGIERIDGVLSINTNAAELKVRDARRSLEDVDGFLKKHYRNYRQNKWKKELRTLAAEKGKSASDLCRYLGIPQSDTPRFWMRMPKHREYYIGIGMCLGQSLDTINRWIKKYGGSRQLYIKDIKSDLVWIYLVNASYNDSSERNYYLLYDKVSDEVDLAYTRLWNDNIGNIVDTDRLYDEFKYLNYDDESINLLRFVEEHFEYFKTAYVRPRKMLHDYLNIILDGLNAVGKEHWTLNGLRGYLDDNMINYLSGNYMYINTKSHEDGKLTHRLKRIPKSKKAHIELAVALGMTVQDINTYLVEMGYAPLDPTDSIEGKIIKLMVSWEMQHPEQLALIGGMLKSPVKMRLGAESMLDMREYIADNLAININKI